MFYGVWCRGIVVVDEYVYFFGWFGVGVGVMGVWWFIFLYFKGNCWSWVLFWSLFVWVF